MATWINHLRIAESFMNNYDNLNNLLFLVGNIAPDCGVPNKDHSAFIPDKVITHWKTDKDNGAIDAEGFRQRYLQLKSEYYPFYLGYYFHLLVDIEWEKFYHLKRQEPLYKEGFKNNKNFIWTVKQDWYAQDCMYLRDNKNFIFFSHFIKIKKFPNIYLDYYPEDIFINQIRYIKRFYLLLLSKESPKKFFYLTKEENDNFVYHVIKKIEDLGYTY